MELLRIYLHLNKFCLFISLGDMVDFDVGFMKNGYCSDWGSPFFYGKAPEICKKGYAALNEGILHMVRNIVPYKTTIHELYKMVADKIEELGFIEDGLFIIPEGTELKVVKETRFSEGERGEVKCYGADDVSEGVAIMAHEGVDVSITGNSTNPTRFQHPVAGTYKKERVLAGKPYFSVASGGGTGRTLHPDNMAAGPASYGMTDTMGRMHSDAQFAGSSSVPAHVEMMGFLGIGNNPMVGCSVACAVDVAQALAAK